MHQQYQNPRNYETSNKRDYQDYSRASSRSNYNNGAISEEPNANVVIQGLGYETNEQQVTYALQQLEANIESVRVVMDRKTGMSKGFAFVKFISTEHARQFMESNGGPFLWINGLKVKMEYSHGITSTILGVNIHSDDWLCNHCGINNFSRREKCFKCGVYKPMGAVLVKDQCSDFQMNEGTRDIGEIPINLLLIRGLDSLSTEESLYKLLCSHTDAVKEVRLVKDRLSHLSWGFAFVEYTDVPSAAKALTHLLNNPLVIESRNVSVSYAHANSFSPVYSNAEWASSYVYDHLGNAIPVMYWDVNAYTAPWGAYCENPPVAETTDPTTVAVTTETSEKLETTEKEEEKNFDDQLAAFYAEMNKDEEEKPKESKKRVIEQVEEAAKTPFKKFELKKSTTSSSIAGGPNKKVKIQLQKWTQKQEELHEPVPEIPINPKSFSSGPVEYKVASSVVIDLSDEAIVKMLPTLAETNEKYSTFSPSTSKCLLCQRQFKSPEDLIRHQNKSALHKSNYEEHLSKSIKEMRGQLEQQPQEYTDRAAERRKIHGSGGIKWKKGGSNGNSTAGVVKVEQPTKFGIQEDNVGNRMLQKMGWKKDTGLGADSNGIINPLQADGYTRGVGIGAGSSGSSRGGTYQQNMQEQRRRRFEETLKQ